MLSDAIDGMEFGTVKTKGQKEGRMINMIKRNRGRNLKNWERQKEGRNQVCKRERKKLIKEKTERKEGRKLGKTKGREEEDKKKVKERRKERVRKCVFDTKVRRKKKKSE